MAAFDFLLFLAFVTTESALSISYHKSIKYHQLVIVPTKHILHQG